LHTMNTMPVQTPLLVVMLSGWAGSGKDTAAALLADELDFERRAFADALKEDVAALTGIPVGVFHSARKNAPLVEPVAAFPGAHTPRDCLIACAAAVRAEDPDTYPNIVAEQIKNRNCIGKRFAITDWRYANEYAAFKRLLPATATILRVRIERPGMTPLADPSEHNLDDATFDAVVQNDGSISDLRDKIKAVVHPYLCHGAHLC
jgi:hypothetical protein